MPSHTRRSVLAIASTALALGSGCVSSPRAGDAAGQTTAPHWANDCGFRVRVERADEANAAHAENRVDFANFSEQRRREFEAALANGSAPLSDGVDPYEKGTTTVVDYDGAEYAAVLVPC